MQAHLVVVIEGYAPVHLLTVDDGSVRGTQVFNEQLPVVDHQLCVLPGYVGCNHGEITVQGPAQDEVGAHSEAQPRQRARLHGDDPIVARLFLALAEDHATACVAPIVDGSDVVENAAFDKGVGPLQATGGDFVEPGDQHDDRKAQERSNQEQPNDNIAVEAQGRRKNLRHLNNRPTEQHVQDACAQDLTTAQFTEKRCGYCLWSLLHDGAVPTEAASDALSVPRPESGTAMRSRSPDPQRESYSTGR